MGGDVRLHLEEIARGGSSSRDRERDEGIGNQSAGVVERSPAEVAEVLVAGVTDRAAGLADVVSGNHGAVADIGREFKPSKIVPTLDLLGRADVLRAAEKRAAERVVGDRVELGGIPQPEVAA